MRNKQLIVTAAMLTVAACGKPGFTTPEAAAPAPSAAATGVKPGTYKVCDAGQHSGHGSYTGERLAIGDTIEIWRAANSVARRYISADVSPSAEAVDV